MRHKNANLRYEIPMGVGYRFGSADRKHPLKQLVDVTL